MFYKSKNLCAIISVASVCFVIFSCQTTSPRRVLQPDDNMLAMCLEDTKTTARANNSIEINCDLSPISIEYVLKDPSPDATHAKIKCQGHDEDGKLVVSTCTCQGDEKSNCKSFAQRCRDKGYEELGGGPEFSICHINPQ